MVVSVEGPPVAFAAKTATTTIPIVFTVSDDPVRLGLVASLARPGGNVTGINFFSNELLAKRLELLRALVPTATRVAVLVNPANTANTETTLKDVEPAARAVGLQIQVLNADTSHEIDAAFATIVRERPDALFSASSPYFTSRRIQLVQLAARHAIPATYPGRQYVEVGGLMSYGANVAERVASTRRLCRPHPQGRKARGPAGRAGVEVRAGDQPPHRQDARPHRAAIAARHGRRGDRMSTRREFVTLVGGTALAWPLAARAQQSAMPVIGFLNGTSADGFARARNGFIQGLKETSYIVDQNVAIEYRWAEGQYDRLPALAADLLRRQVAVLVVNNAAAPAAMAATATIPIVFASGADPVKSGLVVSLNRPSSNVTGVYFLIDALPTKNLHLLHELVPRTSTVALLVNPNNAVAVGTELPSVQTAARTLGLDLVVVKAAAERDIDAAFADVVHARAGALVIASDSFIFGHRQQIIALAERHSIPTAYPWREAPAAGGLVSYGTSLTDAYRLAGVFTGRILGGAKPADLPVQQSTKFELADQSQDREGARPRSTANSARPRRRGDRMKRREFITLLGGAAAWPLAARAQQAAMPVVGFLRAARLPRRSSILQRRSVQGFERRRLRRGAERCH